MKFFFNSERLFRLKNFFTLLFYHFCEINFQMGKVSWFFVGLLVLILGVVVYNKVLFPPENGGGKPMGGVPKEMAVNAYVVQPKQLSNNIVASGTLLAFEEVDLHPEVSGKIISLNLNEGVPVVKGSLLVKLFDADLQAQMRKLESQKETAERTEQRLKQLLSINGIGQQEYDDALTHLNGILADMDYIRAQISKTEIRAPFNGVVGLRNVSNGAFVSPTTSIATLQQVDPLKIDFTIPEKYQSSIKRDDQLHFNVDGFSTAFLGKVYAIEPRIDEATRTIKVRALVQNPNARLFPGAFAKVDVGLKTIQNAMMVPTQCIIPEARSKKIIVVKNGKAEFRKVETGIRNESYIQITSGVETGDTVVATAIMYVKPDMALKVMKVME